MVIEMCGPLETMLSSAAVTSSNCTSSSLHTNSLLVFKVFPGFPGVSLAHWQHGHVYSADNIEPHLTGVVVRYLLASVASFPGPMASDNAAALPCKHHENGSENETKVCIFA